MKTIIYALICPITQQVRYVGKSIEPKKRYNRHLISAKNRRNHKENWIYSLQQQGLVPIFNILEECNEENWEESERFYICYFKSLGFNLTNHTEGGEGSIGYRPTSETIERLRLSHIGHKRNSDSIEKTRLGNYKPILQLTLDGTVIKKWDAAIIAEKEGGFSRKSISRCCKGELNKHKGYNWKYYEAL